MSVKMTAGDLVQGDLVSIGPEADLGEAARRMDVKRISCLLVMRDGEVLGILSKTDIVHSIACGETPGSVTVESAMSSGVVSCPADTPVVNATAMLRDHRLHHLLVTREGRPVGVVSVYDLAGPLVDIVRVYDQMSEGY